MYLLPNTTLALWQTVDTLQSSLQRHNGDDEPYECETRQTAENNEFFFPGKTGSTGQKINFQRRLLPCHALSSRRPWFDPDPVQVKLVVDNSTPGQVLLRALLFTIGGAIPSTVHTPVSLNITLLSRANRRNVGNFKQKNVPPNIG